MGFCQKTYIKILNLNGDLEGPSGVNYREFIGGWPFFILVKPAKNSGFDITVAPMNWAEEKETGKNGIYP